MAVAGLRRRQVSSIALDHVGVVTDDLHVLAEQYEQLGFTLTLLARQEDGRIGNRCAMLRRSYIELLAVVDPTAKSATLDRFLERYAGIHIMAFSIDDPQSALTRLRGAGIDVAGISQLSRVIDDTHPAAGRARFALIQTPEQPEGRINLVHHLTPELLWQERFLMHANGAEALDEVVIVVAEPAETAARFSRLVGCAVVPDPDGGFALDLMHGRVRLRAVDGDASVVPCIVGLSVRTSDGNAAIKRLLGERGIAHRLLNGGVLIDPAHAGGVALRFVTGAAT
jgi:hypothetical protein